MDAGPCSRPDVCVQSRASSAAASLLFGCLSASLTNISGPFIKTVPAGVRGEEQVCDRQTGTNVHIPFQMMSLQFGLDDGLGPSEALGARGEACELPTAPGGGPSLPLRPVSASVGRRHRTSQLFSLFLSAASALDEELQP